MSGGSSQSPEPLPPIMYQPLIQRRKKVPVELHVNSHTNSDEEPDNNDNNNAAVSNNGHNAVDLISPSSRGIGAQTPGPSAAQGEIVSVAADVVVVHPAADADATTTSSSSSSTVPPPASAGRTPKSYGGLNTLGAPMETVLTTHPSHSSSVVSPNFDYITKLPTPIVGPPGGGRDSFPVFQPSPPRHGELHDLGRSPPDKRTAQAQAHPFQPSIPRSRIISEYRPNLVADRSYKLQQITNQQLPSSLQPPVAKRFVSNPTERGSVIDEGSESERENERENENVRRPLHENVRPSNENIRTLNTNSISLSNPMNIPMDIDNEGTFPHQSDSNLDTFCGTRSSVIYHKIKQIGAGSFSKVVLAEDSSGNQVAVKIISVPHSSKEELCNFKSYIERELAILSQLNHPCITKLLDFRVTVADSRYNLEKGVGNLEKGVGNSDQITQNLIERDLFQPHCNISDEEFSKLKESPNQLMFLRYSPGGNLFEFSSNQYQSHHLTLSFWKYVQRMVAELVISVGYLHINHIIHRDIKLENILLNVEPERLFETRDNNILGEGLEDPTLSSSSNPESSTSYSTSSSCSLISLTDFGLSKVVQDLDEELSTRCGSEDYISPELLMGLKYNGQLTDAWSVGVVIYSLVENRLPFDLPSIELMTSAAAAAAGAAGSGGAYNQGPGISPSVLKRQRSRNKTPHRIAMIDWGWFKATELHVSTALDPESKQIIEKLQRLTEALLVRKQKRLKILEVLQDDKYKWIKECVPESLLR
ncbi:hypothetical protein CAAN3_04S01200 [[Candida] anglica]